MFVVTLRNFFVMQVFRSDVISLSDYNMRNTFFLIFLVPFAVVEFRLQFWVWHVITHLFTYFATKFYQRLTFDPSFKLITRCMVNYFSYVLAHVVFSPNSIRYLRTFSQSYASSLATFVSSYLSYNRLGGMCSNSQRGLLLAGKLILSDSAFSF